MCSVRNKFESKLKRDARPDCRVKNLSKCHIFKYSADAESGMATALKEALSGSACAKLVT